MFVPSILSPLSLEETKELISLRCNLAQIDNPFSDGAVETIYHLTNGIPSYILNLCFCAYKNVKGKITPEVINKISKSMDIINEPLNRKNLSQPKAQQ